MDAKLSAAEITSHISNSSGSSPLSFPSDDFKLDGSVKDRVLMADGNKKGIGSDYSDESGSENGGFVSGEEEFETAFERPIPGGADEGKGNEGDYVDAPPVDSSEFSMPHNVLPTENPTLNVDNDDQIVGNFGVLKKEPFGNADKGLKGNISEYSIEKRDNLVEFGSTEKKLLADFGVEKADVEGMESKLNGGTSTEEHKGDVLNDSKEEGAVVQDSLISGAAAAKVDSVIEETSAEKVVEIEGVKFTGRGDSVVDAVHVDLAGPGVALVGDMGESKSSSTNGKEVPVSGTVNLANGFDRSSHNEKGHADLSAVSERNDVIPVLSNKVENVEAEAGDKNLETCVNESGSTGLVSNEEKPTTGIEAEADFQAKLNEPVEELSSEKIDGGGGDAAQKVDQDAESIKVTASREAGNLDNGSVRVVDESAFPVFSELNTASVAEINSEAKDEEKHHLYGGDESEGSVADGEAEGMIFESSEAAKQFLEELEQGSGVGSHSVAESSHNHSQDGQIVTDSEEEVDTDEEGEEKELFDSAALAALLKAATGAGSDDGNITIASQDGSRLFSVERPAGLGSSLRSVKPAPRSNRPNLFTPTVATGRDSENNMTEEEKNKLEKLQQLRVKFLRLVHRLGHTQEDSIAAQVLYRLALVAGRQTSQLFSLESAKRTALELEAEGKDDLNFSLNILVLGKTGVGKSATINSIFGEEKASIHAFQPATTSVKEVTGTVDGVKIRVIDTPGLKSSAMEQGANRRVLASIKKSTKKCPPDIVLYVDRLDTQTRDLNDLPLLRSITSSLGSSIWRNVIVTLTHAASAPPDGPSGSPLSYEVFVAQRSHVVQQSIGHAVGDLRLMNPSLMNPVSLVENHPSCRKNRDGHKVLPNGQSWRPQLLMLCYSMKILSEASSLSKAQDPFDHKKLFGFRVRSPPLPYLLSWLLQSRAHPKLSTEQGGENGDSDIDMADLSDSDQEEDEDEYDQLPPFKPLRKAQLAKLSKEQRKAYLEEYDYRVKLLQKKQWREELRRMREIKKKGKAAVDEYNYMGEDADQENGGPAAVPVPLPDMVLPPSFDADNPAYRYRFLEPTSQFLARPVLDTHGWDHDCGYDGVNLEHSLAIVSRFPAAVAVQLTKDKKEFNIHLDSSIAAKHGDNGSSMAGFDIQNVGKQLAYILRGETKFKNLKRNKTAAGFSVTFLGENVATGLKLEDQIAVGKRLMLVGSTGTVRSQGDAAYGANLELRLRDADFPISQDQSSLSLSLVKWRGDLALGANLQSQFSVGRSSKIAVRAGLNNKMSGQITLRTSSSDQLQIALMGILPIAMAIYKSFRPGVGESYSSMY